mgnify:FL=1
MEIKNFKYKGNSLEELYEENRNKAKSLRKVVIVNS